MSKRKLKLGDAITKLAKALHIPHCSRCEERRQILNEIQTLGIKETMKRLKAAGLRTSAKSAGEVWSVEDIIKKMEDCCDK